MHTTHDSSLDDRGRVGSLVHTVVIYRTF